MTDATPRSASESSGAALPCVEVRAATRTYPARHGDGIVAALRACSLEIVRGTLVAVRGPSGCGKTTLLRLIAALDRPTSGEILHDGQKLSELSEAELSTRRRSIGIVFQDATMLPRLPVWENVAYPLIPRGLWRPRRIELAMNALERLDIAHLARKAPEELSGGERQRVGVARAIVASPDLLVADEPAAHVDDETAEGILALLREERDAGRTVVVATHRADLAEAADVVFSPPR